MHLSELERSQLKEAFDLFDQDESGRVSAAAIRHCLLDIQDKQAAQDPAHYYKILILLEQYRDRGVSFQEFVEIFGTGASHLLTNKTISRQEALRLFRLVDTDSRGKITVRDLKRVCDEIGEPISIEEIEEMIHRADIDGDGAINAEEFFRVVQTKRDIKDNIRDTSV